MYLSRGCSSFLLPLIWQSTSTTGSFCIHSQICVTDLLKFLYSFNYVKYIQILPNVCIVNRIQWACLHDNANLPHCESNYISARKKSAPLHQSHCDFLSYTETFWLTSYSLMPLLLSFHPFSVTFLSIQCAHLKLQCAYMFEELL
jgi:hypothetical protein